MGIGAEKGGAKADSPRELEGLVWVLTEADDAGDGVWAGAWSSGRSDGDAVAEWTSADMMLFWWRMKRMVRLSDPDNQVGARSAKAGEQGQSCKRWNVLCS